MTKINAINLDVTPNADGFDLAGGTTPRKLTISGADIGITATTISLGAVVLTSPATTDTLVGRVSNDTLTSKTITDATNNVAANSLKSATTIVSVSAATAPTLGQVLTAVNSTTATWQNSPSGFADPMSAAGDIIYRDGTNTTTRLPLGVTGKILKSNGTTVVWGDGGGDVSSTASVSVDNEMALYSSTTGKIIKRASSSGIVKLTSGVVSMASAGSDYVSPTGSEALTNKTITDATNNVAAKSLYSATTNVDVFAATAPSNGQVLTATDSTHAIWQTPASGFSDPMTNRGDIIYRDSINVTTRLSLGSLGQVLRSNGTDLVYASLTKSDVGLGSVDNLQQLPMSYLDIDGTLATDSDTLVASQKATKTYVDTGLATKEGTITAGTTGQYWRGDKSWQTLDKTVVSLSSVDDVQQMPLSYLDIDGALTADSDSKVASQKATKTYADTKMVGPVASTNEHIAIYDGISGKLLKDSAHILPSGIIIGDTDAQSLTNKTLTSSTNTLGGVTMGCGTDAIGDIYYNGGSNILTNLAGNITVTTKFLSQTGSGAFSAAPTWTVISAADVGLSNVTNDAQIPISAFTTKGDLLVATGAGTYASVGVGSNGQNLTADNTQASGVAWVTPAGTGDVLGPATNTDSYIPQWNNANSKTLKDGLFLDTDGTLAADSDGNVATQKAVKAYADSGLALKENSLGFTPENVANKDIDGTLAANSDTKYASQKATKTYVDTAVLAGSVDATTTNKGVVEIATAAEARAGTVFGGTGASLVLPAAISKETSAASTVPVTRTDTFLDSSFGGGASSLATLNAGSLVVENPANLDIDGTLTADSDTKIASQKATKTYADTKLPSNYLDTDGTLAADSDSKVASQKATKTYVDTGLATKLTPNAPIVGATKTKITYDINGLITVGADATTADIADSTNKRYVTDAHLVILGNTSNSNTGDQDLSGLVPYTGATGNVNLGANTITSLSSISTTVYSPDIYSAGAGDVDLNLHPAGTGIIKALSNLKVGTGSAGDQIIFANNGAGTLPAIKYNDTSKRWQYSNSGTYFTVNKAYLVVATDDSGDYKCTGTSDQTIINQAISDLPAAGGTVHIKAGTYSLSGSISCLKTGSTIEGDGWSTILQAANASNLTDVVDVGNGSTTLNNVTVRNLTIDGNRYNQSSGNSSPLVLYGGSSNPVKGCHVENCNLINARQDCLKLIYAEDNKILNNNLYNNNGGGIAIFSASNYNTVSGNTGISGTYFIYDSFCNENIYTNNTSRSCTYGIVLYYSLRVSVLGNITYGSLTSGFYMRGVDNITFSGNNSYNDATGLIVATTAANRITITGNTFNYPTNTAMIIGNGVTVTTCSITGNTIYGAGTHGIYLAGCNYFTITGNTFDYCSRTASGTSASIFMATSTYCTVTGNTFLASGGNKVSHHYYESSSASNYNIIDSNIMIGATTAARNILGANDVVANNI